MDGRVEEKPTPPEESIVGMESITPEGTMTPPSPADTTPKENTIIQPSTIRLIPKIINLAGLTGPLNPI
jgi:hypothetical protein